MKVLYSTITLICLTFPSNAQAIKVADIINGQFKIELDTIVFKNKLREAFAADTSTVHFSSISIETGVTLNEKKLPYYYLKLYEPNRHLTITRWLDIKKNSLYLAIDTAFKESYVFCTGQENCVPNVFVVNGELSWGCGDTMQCFLDESKMTCSKKTAVLLDD